MQKRNAKKQKARGILKEKRSRRKRSDKLNKSADATMSNGTEMSTYVELDLQSKNSNGTQSKKDIRREDLNALE